MRETSHYLYSSSESFSTTTTTTSLSSTARDTMKQKHMPSKPTEPTKLANDGDDPMEDPISPREQEDLDMLDGDIDIGEDFEDSEERFSEEDGSDALAQDSDLEKDGGVSMLAGRSLSPSSIPMLNQQTGDESTVMSASAVDNGAASLHPQKPSPYVHDAGHMLITDPNPLSQMTSATLEASLASTARDAAQSLLNHMLTTCPIHRAPPASTSSSGITMMLPQPVYGLPREKKIPQPRPPTKWEQFAAKKGIGRNKAGGGITKVGELESASKKMVFDEARDDWVPKWGYKGRNKKGEGEWLVEVDEKKGRQQTESSNMRSENRTTRKDRIRRNERLQRANERKGRKGKTD